MLCLFSVVRVTVQSLVYLGSRAVRLQVDKFNKMELT
jgi:hypothetical protein